MRLQPIEIGLGDKSWIVRPLTVAQVQAIEPLVFGSAEARAGSVASAVAILRVALARDHADAAAGLDEVEAAAPDIARAVAQVLRLGGFLPADDVARGEPMRGDIAPGEAGAGAAPASTGAASTRV